MTMSTLTDLAPLWRTQCPLVPRPTPSSSVFRSFPHGRPSIRCSIAKEESAVSSPYSSGAPGGHSDSVDCVVVGGGISGLCIAQALATKHSSVAPNLIVTEARDRVGGNIITVQRDGYLWEEGPNSFQPSDPMLTMVVDSGLKDDLVLGDPNAPRFVLWDGKLKPVPSKPTDLAFFDLMSIGGKLRAGFGALGIRPPPPGHEESIEEFVRRNLGDEVFERLIEPFCSGVYAGDPSKLSMKAAFGKVWKLEQNGGSIIGGTFKTIQERNKVPKQPRDPRLPKPKGQTVGSLRKGLAMLPDAISTRLGKKVKLSWKLSSIRKLDEGGYSLTYETPQGLVSLQSKSVVMTVPSYIASSLLRPLSAAAADALSKFYYPPVAAVSISYPKEAIRTECLINGELKGFGQLHPRSQGVETLAKYASDLLSRAGLTNCKIVDSPLETNVKLRATDGELLSNATLYRQLVGSLIYLTVTGPDLDYAVHLVCQFMTAPHSVHYAAVLRILRYVKGTFKKQFVVARSSTEAEYRALANITSELLWLRWLLHNMGVSQTSSSLIFCDNRSAIQIAHNDVFHERTKHIKIDCHSVRHHLLQGTLHLCLIASVDQLADVFTKAHPPG
ncbi:protoporphyrinogen oxidase 1, chloroplastic-like [Corylus avellana]|uniref:protoporphyrinogen oxidase 1, chloroplastic-like n=1 Tax=Corylus avellana TaxID=13451 RepID=UPI00286A69C0|nr:protoporphyrinogen oxidase 1, chloroplastic-like [Corylus avellana]